MVDAATEASTDDSDEEEPLLLTPYIEKNDIENGRKASQVTQLGWDIESYSGLLTVDKKYDSNMFFWFFPSEYKRDKVPLLVWLNGFSTASTYGIFLQNGPYSLLKSPKPVPWKASWQKHYNVLYLDNPVGVGFSYCNSTEGYSTDVDMISLNLHTALQQFVKLFPDLANRELYITGLSLAGKYATSFAHRIFKEKLFKMKGIFLGNPLLDPSLQVNYGDYLYQLGFIDKRQEKFIDDKEKSLMDDINNKNDDGAYKKANDLFLSDDSFILKETGLNSVFNYDRPYINTKYYNEMIKSRKLKRAVHVGNTTFDEGNKAMSMASKIFTFPVTGFLQDMVETIKMLFYAGQVDIACGYPMLVDVLHSINWTGKENYGKATRYKIYCDDEDSLWGYIKGYKTLSDVMIRKAGHSALSDKPEVVLDLLMNFTEYGRFK